MKNKPYHLLIFSIFIILLLVSCSENKSNKRAENKFDDISSKFNNNNNDNKKIIYLVSDMRIRFWAIMAKGIADNSKLLGYELEVYDAQNSAKKELELTIKAFKENIAGLIISPTNSSASATILKLAKRAGVPVVISDIGADKGEYVSYISSNNREGAYKIGKILSKKLLNLGWQDGTVGIVAISQKRLNGQERTAGFMKAMEESNIKSADIKQLVTSKDIETYTFVKDMIQDHSNLRAIWLQTSGMYKGAIEAIKDTKKTKDVLLIAFDAENLEFLDAISKDVIIGSGMQQPYLMGQEAVNIMVSHLEGKKVSKNIQLPILVISAENISNNLDLIKKTVLGISISKDDENNDKL